MKRWIETIKKNNKGFTLVELIVVIAVLAVITVVIAPTYIKYVEKARVGTDVNAIGEIAHIAEVEYVDLEADREISGGAEINVVCNAQGNFEVTGSGEANGKLATAVKAMMGTYEVKSKTYKNASAVKITIDANGNAHWSELAITY